MIIQCIGGARYVPGTTSNVGNDGLNDPFTGGSRYNPGGTSSTNQPINVSFASKSSNAVSSNPHYPIVRLSVAMVTSHVIIIAVDILSNLYKSC